MTKNKLLKIIFITLGAIVLICLSIILFAFFKHNSFYKQAKENGALSQENTHWVSDCGRVSFEVEKYGEGKGRILLSDGKEVEIVLCADNSKEQGIFVYDLADSYISEVTDGFGKKYEFTSFKKTLGFWKPRYYKKDYFVAVVKESTYFKQGEKLVFRRVDDL